jgi:hypothetical protein
MSSRPVLVSASPRRTAPRCHGGASSLLRLSAAALPRHAVAARTSAWRELDDVAAVEHVVRRPLCAPGATLWS